MSETLFHKEFLEKLEYLFLVSKKILSGKNKAERRSRKIGSGIEFADYREYVLGDDIRHIDWNLYSRLQKLFLRLYEEEEDLHVYILLDVSSSMRGSTLNRYDYGRKVAAALSYIALSNLDRVSVLAFGDSLVQRLPPSRGKKNIFKVLHFLDALPTSQHTDLETSFKTFIHQNHRRGVAVVISDFFDRERYQSSLNLLRYHKHDIFAIQLTDEREFHSELIGDIELVDQESGETLQTTLSPQVIKRFQQEYEAFLKEMEQFCLKNEISYFKTSIQTPFEDLLLNIFRRGGFIRK